MIDGRNMVDTVKRKETESALTQSLRTDGRLNCQKREKDVDTGSKAQTERSCPIGHSEFNLRSVESSDFVRLNPGLYLSTLSGEGRDWGKRGRIFRQ